jgi:DNA-binding GntR family transcriptional regulator
MLQFQVPNVIASDLLRFLEDQIVFGELPPGARLIEEDIVRQYGVSRTPVREALRVLEQQGLAVRESRRGLWVRNIDLQNLDEVYSCRLPLEGLVVQLAVERRTEQDLLDIKNAIDALAEVRGTSSVRDFFRLNIELSNKLYRAARNETLQRLLLTIGKQSYRYRFLAYSHFPEMMQASVEGHREILAAMQKPNPRYARILMEDMIQKSWDSIRAFLADNPSAIEGGAAVEALQAK